MINEKWYSSKERRSCIILLCLLSYLTTFMNAAFAGQYVVAEGASWFSMEKEVVKSRDWKQRRIRASFRRPETSFRWLCLLMKCTTLWACTKKVLECSVYFQNDANSRKPCFFFVGWTCPAVFRRMVLSDISDRRSNSLASYYWVVWLPCQSWEFFCSQDTLFD